MNSSSFAEAAVVRVCSPTRNARALWLALSGLQPEDRDSQIAAAMAGIRKNEITFDGLWEATRHEHLVGAGWSYVMPGRMAVVWPPQLLEGELPTTADQILQGQFSALKAQGVHLIQSVLPVDCPASVDSLPRNGFVPLANLLFLVAPRKVFPDSLPASVLKFVHVRESDFSRLGTLAEKTYTGTLDCPNMDGLRDSLDVLEGYRASGTSRTSYWYFVLHDEKEIGCLLLNDFAEQNQWELVYMGLVPEARGRGWGKQIVRHGLWLARQSDCLNVILAVDEQNLPALAMYGEAGFSTWGKRSVWIKSLR